ncbi:MFS transporter [Priestia endophytica]|uniref:MFS transporter n=1 Tax=Priestia endophytica TaxID=135735 RepID=UPI000F527F3B|nr:hypothetical protein FH5_00732 [Priestia endophytica]
MLQEEKKRSEMMPKSNFKLFMMLPILSWALYDFANTIFSSNITTIFFPFYLQEVVGDSERMNQIASTFISYANAVSSLFLVIFAPLFGVLIDRTGQKKKYVTAFTLISVFFTMMMGFLAMEDGGGTVGGLPLSLILVIICFVIAKFFYNSSLVFYDPILADISTKENMAVVSGFGTAVGYIGTLVGLSIYPFVSSGNYHEAFIPTALLFLLFSLPFIFFTKEKEVEKKGEKASFWSGYRDIIATFKEMKSYKAIFYFMIAYFFLNDAIATAVAMMSVYSTAIVGFGAGEFILLYLVSTVASIIGSFLFGFICKKWGAWKSIVAVGIILIVALSFAVVATNSTLFWVAGSLFGVSLGSLWVTTRTFIIELTPQEKRGQFFGLFAFSGKVSSVVGPFLYGTITLLLADYGNLASRVALGSLIILVLFGLFFHRFVRKHIA